MVRRVGLCGACGTLGTQETSLHTSNLWAYGHGALRLAASGAAAVAANQNLASRVIREQGFNEEELREYIVPYSVLEDVLGAPPLPPSTSDSDSDEVLDEELENDPRHIFDDPYVPVVHVVHGTYMASISMPRDAVPCVALCVLTSAWLSLCPRFACCALHSHP